MKNKINNSLLLFSLIVFSSLSAQIAGNQVYQNQSIIYNRNPVETKPIYSTDSTLVVTSKVLLNKIAESYIVTVGVSSIKKTVVEANHDANRKIENIINKLIKSGFAEDDFLSLIHI